MNKMFLPLYGLVLSFIVALPASLQAQGMQHHAQHQMDGNMKHGAQSAPLPHPSCTDCALSAPAGNQHPRQGGQDAFAAIQEIVLLLEGDNNTDWSRVDLEALRQHLIDMNEVALRAKANPRRLPNGLEVVVTGEGRTLAAIHAMLLPHSEMLNGYHSWAASAVKINTGVRLTVTSSDPREVAHIQGLGFIGLMVSGAHHQAHHLALAKGENVHRATH